MTFDLHMTFDLDTEVKNVISLKTSILLQETSDSDMGKSRDFPLVGTYMVITDKGSKVIKGSFPIFS